MDDKRPFPYEIIPVSALDEWPPPYKFELVKMPPFLGRAPDPITQKTDAYRDIVLWNNRAGLYKVFGRVCQNRQAVMLWSRYPDCICLWGAAIPAEHKGEKLGPIYMRDLIDPVSARGCVEHYGYIPTKPKFVDRFSVMHEQPCDANVSETDAWRFRMAYDILTIAKTCQENAEMRAHVFRVIEDQMGTAKVMFGTEEDSRAIYQQATFLALECGGDIQACLEELLVAEKWFLRYQFHAVGPRESDVVQRLLQNLDSQVYAVCEGRDIPPAKDKSRDRFMLRVPALEVLGMGTDVAIFDGKGSAYIACRPECLIPWLLARFRRTMDRYATFVACAMSLEPAMLREKAHVERSKALEPTLLKMRNIVSVQRAAIIRSGFTSSRDSDPSSVNDSGTLVLHNKRLRTSVATAKLSHDSKAVPPCIQRLWSDAMNGTHLRNEERKAFFLYLFNLGYELEKVNEIWREVCTNDNDPRVVKCCRGKSAEEFLKGEYGRMPGTLYSSYKSSKDSGKPMAFNCKGMSLKNLCPMHPDPSRSTVEWYTGSKDIEDIVSAGPGPSSCNGIIRHAFSPSDYMPFYAPVYYTVRYAHLAAKAR